MPPCSGNGEVQLPFGTAVYVGLGALVFAMLVFLELFGELSKRNEGVHVPLRQRDDSLEICQAGVQVLCFGMQWVC